MASQSQPPSIGRHTLASCAPGPRLDLSRPSRSCPTFNPFAINHLRIGMPHAAPVTQEESAACTYLPSPRRCARMTGKNASSLFAPLVSTLDFSVACGLFQSLCPLFRTPVLYFQQLTASFPKTPGWGAVSYCGPLEPTVSRCSCCWFQGVGARICDVANDWRGHSEPAGDTGYCDGQNVCRGGWRCARLCAARCSTCRASSSVAHVLSVRDPYRVQGEANSPLRRRRDAEKAGFSLRSRCRI
jgi:hypothetical protein